MPKKKKSKKQKRAGKKKRAAKFHGVSRYWHYRSARRMETIERIKKKADEDDDDPESGKYAGPRAV